MAVISGALSLLANILMAWNTHLSGPKSHRLNRQNGDLTHINGLRQNMRNCPSNISHLLNVTFSTVMTRTPGPSSGIVTRTVGDVVPSVGRAAMRWLGALAVAIILAPVAAGAAECGARTPLSDGWTMAAPERAGLDPARICAIGPRLAGLRAADAHGVVIVRHGALVYQDYFTGDDARWPEVRGELARMPHDARTKHDMQSITKSVVGLLVGVALDRGAIRSIDAPVLSFFPAYADLRTPAKDRITLRDMLTMTSGLRWPGTLDLAMGREMDATSDPYRFVLEQPLLAAPGTSWRYSNGSAEVVGAVLRQETGRPLDQYAREVLFKPLGITDWEWGRMGNGFPAASWGLRLRPRDLAKIGQLVLDQGVWHGQRIVSSGWIKAMTAPQVVRPGGWYGYLWWPGRSSIDGRTINWTSAVGRGGQYLYVVPSMDLVVVVTAGVYDDAESGHQSLAGETTLGMALRAAMRH